MISSIRPASRYCRAALAPPPIATSLFPGGRHRLLERRLDSLGDEGEGRLPEPQRLARMMGEHEDRHPERWLLSPPALPGILSPGAGPAAEHVAPHQRGADSLAHLLGDLGAGVDLAALLARGALARRRARRPTRAAASRPPPAGSPRSGSGRRRSRRARSRCRASPLPSALHVIRPARQPRPRSAMIGWDDRRRQTDAS